MDSHQLKLERAREHLAALELKVSHFLAQDPGTTVGEWDASTGRYICRFIVRQHPPQDFGPLIGDFLFNLRSSLDHLVYHMTRVHMGHPIADTGFPILDSPEQLDRRSRRMIRGLPQDAQANIELAQPYHNADGLRKDPLWILNRLCNIDKHRIVHIVLTHPAVANYAFNLPVLHEQFFEGPHKDGSIVATFSVPAEHAGEPVSMTAEVRCQVVFGEGEPPITRPLVDAFRTLYDAIREDVMPIFQPFL